MRLDEMTLMVTGDCNLSCPHCSQGAWRKDYVDYHMTPREIDELASRAFALRLAPFRVVHVAGGEPTRWHYFRDGLAEVKRSGLARRVVISSNCIEYRRLADALSQGLIHRVYCQESNSSPEGVRFLLSAFGERRVNVGRRKIHKPLPHKLLNGVLPARCGCLRMAYFAGRVFQCADVYPHLTRLGLSIDEPRVWCRLDEDWREYFRLLDPTRSDACRACLANRKVWEKI